MKVHAYIGIVMGGAQKPTQKLYQLQSDNRMKNKKTGEEQIVVNTSDFNILNGYLVVMAACENELETLGISMRSH